MSHWKTVIQVDSIQKAHLIRSQLELEGYEVLILDELSTQITPHYNFASGGARIQVCEEDWQNALDYLIELGYVHIEYEKERSGWLKQLSNFTLKIPLLKRARFEVRIVLFVAFILAVIILPIALMNIPPEENELMNTHWCVEEVRHKGKVILPEHSELIFLINGCAYYISFHNENSIHLPAYGDRYADAKWDYANGYLKFTFLKRWDNEGEDNLFLDKFKCKLIGNKLKLKSRETNITLVRN